MKRVIWIILDSVGMGEAPDAAAFGDAGSSTIPHTWEYNKGLNIPNLLKLGLGNIDGMKSLPLWMKAGLQVPTDVHRKNRPARILRSAIGK